MNSVERFFLYSSGVDFAMLEKCPTDRNKYVGIGATVFFTGLLAFFSAAYALFTVFESYPAAIAFGLVWGLMIYNLDRYIVMSMKNQGRWWRDLFVAFPRLVLATLLALVISKPLEMKIFEKEIRGELVQMEQEVFKAQEDRVAERFQSEMTQNRAEIERLKAEIAQKTAARDTLLLEANREADGTGGSKIRNMGPIYRAKKQAADKAQAELDTLLAVALPLIREKESATRSIETSLQNEKTNLERTRYDGMAARMEALSRLSAKSRAIFWASIFITLLFIAIETAPIVVKLISYRSPYDYLLHEHEQVFEMANFEKTALLESKIKNKVRFETETGAHAIQARITAEKAAIDQKLKEKLEELKRSGSMDWSGESLA